MRKRSILWQAAGFAAVTFGGTILHFFTIGQAEASWLRLFPG